MKTIYPKFTENFTEYQYSKKRFKRIYHCKFKDPDLGFEFTKNDICFFVIDNEQRYLFYRKTGPAIICVVYNNMCFLQHDIDYRIDGPTYISNLSDYKTFNHRGKKTTEQIYWNT